MSKRKELILKLAERFRSETVVEEELADFLGKNPNASQYEIALHFFNFRALQEKKVNDFLPKFCGD